MPEMRASSAAPRRSCTRPIDPACARATNDFLGDVDGEFVGSVGGLRRFALTSTPPELRPENRSRSKCRLLLGSRRPEGLAILQRLRRDAELFFEFLNGRPGVDLLYYEVRLRVYLGIVNRHADLE